MSENQMKLPTALVIFGATGDLSRKKLIPALFSLYQKKLLPPTFRIVGYSRQELSDHDYRDRVREILGNKGSVSERESFLKIINYVPGYFDKQTGYERLAQFLGVSDKESNVCSNKLFYLAVPPVYYKPIFKNLASSGLTIPCSPGEGWTKVAVEKPFGKDLKTALELDLLLSKLFKEEQIYRIDHVLAKETAQNILAFRFSNDLLEPVWNRGSIEKIEIISHEPFGIEGRGAFYDGVGALRDVGQNHLLQILALFTMERPDSFSADSVREKRAKILGSLRPISVKEVPNVTLRGQYEGYKNEPGVAKSSKTETYFKIKAFLDDERFKGVPIYLEAGKKMKEAFFEVLITFKHETPCLCPPGQHYQNVLRYRIQPDEKIAISFWVKRPGSQMKIEEKDFTFNYKSAYENEVFFEAYEKLLLDGLEGNQVLFVSTEEIVASWKFVDPILRAWKGDKTPLLKYKPEEDLKEKLVPEDSAKKSEKMKKEIGYVGLGKMGRNMVIRLAEKGWKVSATDVSPEAVKEIRSSGAAGKASLKEMVKSLPKPRLVWVMVPAGEPTDQVLFGEGGLAELLSKDDTVIDGGNSFYEDTLRRAKKLKRRGIRFMDIGTSGGPGGARNGACLMIGGDKKDVEPLEHLYRDLSKDGSAYAHVGPVGAGHFVKMVHNGIEYGMMQALAEGFGVMKKAPFKLDLKKVTEIYNHGSVVESRLVGWLRSGFEAYGEDLKSISGTVGHTGEGEWTVKTAKKLRVPAKVIEESFKFRVASKKKPSYVGQVLSALRNQFGGHVAKKQK